ncbi:Mitochondrial fusion and transport protein ugo1 [Choanephora cucurbitarum]|uniref:Mitochondrial fusion and transport protein ugo1 n=1 Tax=Choanephora cucurbitarum TaxID=101091 RepID=A0A1C7N711_9FUNG|nr:Mitochondrial fusion and transport protein ugo1 [Choanephora cucurbitarum]
MSTYKVNPHRPYYTPGLQSHRNYTSLSSQDTLPPIVDEHDHALKSWTGKVASFAVHKYFITMLTSPFEVGTTLLQVQYSPHQDVEVLGFPSQSIEPITPSQSSNPFHSDTDTDDEEGFFRRPASLDMSRVRPDLSTMTSVSVYDDKNRPVHQMAPMEGGGVLEILNSIIKQSTEGWASLFKGQRVTWLYEMLRAVLRPALESSLNDIFGLYDDTIPLLHLDNVTPNIATMVFSHVAVGILLSPLEIIRTRLVVQSASPLCRKYKGPFHALRLMLSEEGGLSGIYLNKNLIPTILYHTITPLLASSTPLLITRLLHITAADSPIPYGLAELVLSTCGLLLMLPLETIRKRLHCQVPQAASFKTAVALRPQPYRGLLDALYKTMKEEGTKEKRSKKNKRVPSNKWTSSSSEESDADLFTEIKKKESNSTSSAWGIRGLYRGFSMQLAGHVMGYVFHAVNGMEDGVYGLI